MISVVIPCYNASRTIGATIESALQQDTPHEIIVVDDGSSDDSVNKIARFGSRVRCISTINRGVSAARMTGTEMAQGDFIQYVDSDDLLIMGTLALRVGALKRTGADVAHTDWQKFSSDSDGIIQEGDVVRPDLRAIATDCEVATATSRFWAPPAALLYRRSIIGRMPAWHPKLPVIQDARFMFEAAMAGASFVHVPGVGARYRVSPHSLSRQNLPRFIADCALNATEIDLRWRKNGGLSTRREEALTEMWLHVATTSLFQGLEHFGDAREALLRMSKLTRMLKIGHVLRLTLGPAAAAGLARGLANAKAKLGTEFGNGQRNVLKRF